MSLIQGIQEAQKKKVQRSGGRLEHLITSYGLAAEDLYEMMLFLGDRSCHDH